MANTIPIKVMIPIGQVEKIQEWVDDGLFDNVTSFCKEAINRYFDYQRELQVNKSYNSDAKNNDARDTGPVNHD